jgi:hypothetical protein
LDVNHSPKDPPLIPLQVLRFPFEFISQKVFKTLFCLISLLGAKIWIRFGRTSFEIT